jgi:hypothetical protein
MAYDQHSAHAPGPRRAKRSAYRSGVQAERGETDRCGDDHPGGRTLDLLPDLRPNSTPNSPFALRDRLSKQIGVFALTIFICYCLFLPEYALRSRLGGTSCSRTAQQERQSAGTFSSSSSLSNSALCHVCYCHYTAHLTALQLCTRHHTLHLKLFIDCRCK